MSERDPLLALGPPLPVLDPADEAELAEALRAAYAPLPLSSERHAALLAFALEDPFAPASAHELRESERLRQALETGDDGNADAALARALRSALSPPALAREARERTEAAVRVGSRPLEANAPVSQEKAAEPRRNVVFVTFGALALAAAAALALLLARPSAEPPASAEFALTSTARAPELLQSRTTGELFHERFEAGATTARIDRISSARARDLRENRYALWGVR
jgi:hypothetical protein